MKEPNLKEVSYPRFIANSPCGDDLFEGKSQERVAFNIANVVCNNDECKVIGIDGGWGSGKSNLIEIVKKKLNSSENKFHFFIYDAWGHQEDLQRRSLLEEITFFLTKRDDGNAPIIGDSDKWKKKLKELLAKSKETEKKTIPSLSLGIVFSGLILIVTPLFKILSDLVKGTWLKLLIISIPLIGIIILFAYYYFNKTTNTDSATKRIQEAFNQLFYIYQKSQKEEVTFERISEDEPSVKKFREWMNDISNDLQGKKLILVFDNMDRLPNQKVLELWSSIHTFFAENSYENIKVIIPFDRKNIKNAFSAQSGNDTNYTDDFINKTFNIVYRVSPPILSDWKSYFKLKWLEALNETGEDFSKVIQVFDHLSRSKTPREIVAFINELVSIAQIDSNIPHQYIALFIISKQVILENPDSEIIKPSYTKSLNFLYDNDEELPQYMAALVYQIDSNRALEVAFTDKLTSALNNNNADQIKSISESSAFEDILAKSITEVENFENSILGLKTIEDRVLKKSWDDLYQRLNSKMNYSATAQVQPYHLIILDKISKKKEFLKIAFDRYRSADNFVASDYYKTIKEIEKYIVDRRLNLSINDFIKEKKTAAPDFIALLKEIPDANTYSIICDNFELNETLEKITDINDLNSSDYLLKIPSKYSLTKYSLFLEDKIKSNLSDRNLVAAYYNPYKKINKTKVKVLLDDGTIYTHFSASIDPRDNYYYDLLSMRIANSNTFNTTYASYFEDALSKTDSETITGLAANIEYFINYGDLLLKTLNFQKPLFLETVKFLVDGSKVTQRLTLPIVLSKIDSIVEASNIPFDKLVKELGNWDHKVITEKNIPDIVKNVNFFRVCEKLVIPLTIHCNDLANSYFESLSLEEWFVEFQSPKSPVVATSLITLKTQYSTKATSSIKDVLQKIAKSEIPMPDLGTWKMIVEKVNKSSLKATIKNIRDEFINHAEITPVTFIFFGEWLFEYGEMEDKSESLRRIFRKSIIQDESSINIILKYPEKMQTIYKNGREKEDFNIEVKAMIDEGKEFVKTLANILNIELK